MRDFIASQNSERLRQRLSGGMKIREPAAFARLARSLLEIALVTGVVARLYRMIVLSRVTTGTATAIAYACGALFILMMVTLHLSRFPIRDWVWRAPLFAIIESAFEMLTSLVLIALAREPLGTGAAHFHDWIGMSLGTIGLRIVTIPMYALVLGLTVKWVRYAILRKEHAAWTDGTVQAGIPGEQFIERRGSRTASSDPLLFGGRRQHDKKRG